MPRSNVPRRIRPASEDAAKYASVPQIHGPQGPRPPNSATRSNVSRNSAITQGVASHKIGGNYGPYSYAPTESVQTGRYSAATSEMSATTAGIAKPITNTATLPPISWDTKDPDDDFPDPRRVKLNSSFTIFSVRGWINGITLLGIVFGLLVLFIGYPIITFIRRPQHPLLGFNLGGVNGSGQVPDFPNLPSLKDPDTPISAYTRVGTDGLKYDLVFSDEFNQDGRTFFPGDDPFWEAQNQHYWPTGDVEWYDPSTVTTENGKLVITLTMQENNNLNFQSGMLTSWNKICVTTGYIEVSVSLPGRAKVPGLWPGVWTLGNLARAGYGATTEGVWPYSYDSCDLGTFVNQTDRNGNPPQALTGGNGGPLSFLPGQRLSACTCPGSDHPGPSVSHGRGGPEIDIIEQLVDVSIFKGQASQSFQTAPFNYKYDTYDVAETIIYNTSLTKMNTYTGGDSQQAMSALTYLEDQFYHGDQYAPYAIEWFSDPANRQDGYITWFSNNVKTWTINAAALKPDPVSLVSQRPIPEEPMYLIINQGISPTFQKPDYKNLEFPSKMYVDYVRIYQREGTKNGLSCSPPSHPTADYIEKHIGAYSNANLTTWAQAGYSFPRNSQYDGC